MCRVSVEQEKLSLRKVSELATDFYPNLIGEDPISLSWIDDEGDKVLVSTEDEFLEAMHVMLSQGSRCLRFDIFLRSKEIRSDEPESHAVHAQAVRTRPFFIRQHIEDVVVITPGPPRQPNHLNLVVRPMSACPSTPGIKLQ